MNKTVALGLCLVDRGGVGRDSAAGTPVCAVGLGRRGGPGATCCPHVAGTRNRAGAARAGLQRSGESLRRWVSRTEILIHWSESTASGLGSAPAPQAGAGVRNGNRRTARQGSGCGASHRPHAVRRGTLGVGGPGQRRANRWSTSPARGGPPSTRFCSDWSRYDGGLMTMPAATTTAYSEAVLDEIERVVVGKRAALTLILTTLLGRGHVLIEDLPGLGKTLIARSFAAALGLDFKRVQFTPDLLPADLLGSTVYDMQSGRFEFRPGPIFTNLLLADEINRTPPKTQAALLEAMAEGQVSIDGETHRLPAPFIVLATDNPIEYEGTYPLPEAQLDRFATRLELKYLSEQDETFDVASPPRARFGRTDGESGRGHARLPGDARIGRASDGARGRPALCGVAGDGHPASPAGHRRCQPASGNRPGPTRPCAGPAARPGLCDTRGRQDARRPGAWRTGSVCGRRCGCAAFTARMSWRNCCGACRFRGRAGRPAYRDRNPPHRSRVALACITSDAGDRHLRRAWRLPLR